MPRRRKSMPQLAIEAARKGRCKIARKRMLRVNYEGGWSKTDKSIASTIVDRYCGSDPWASQRANYKLDGAKRRRRRRRSR
jgi:hypothetical protein